MITSPTSRCFVLVVTRQERLHRRPVALTTHPASIAAFRRSVMVAAGQIKALLSPHGLEVLPVDAEALLTETRWQMFRHQVDADSWWLHARGRLSRTLEPQLFGQRVRQAAAGNVAIADQLVVVTNQELTPPPQWRYLMWDTAAAEHNAVISGCPMDPYYWGTEIKDRFAVLERRVRAAICATIGELLGLAHCDNEACFMRRDVTSVLELDDMAEYGTEHADAGLGGVTFPPALRKAP